MEWYRKNAKFGNIRLNIFSIISLIMVTLKVSPMILNATLETRRFLSKLLETKTG